MQSHIENSLDLIESCFDHIYKARKAQLVSRSSKYALKLQAKTARVTSRSASPSKVKQYSLSPDMNEDELMAKLSAKFKGSNDIKDGSIEEDKKVLTSSNAMSQDSAKFRSHYKKFLEVRKKVEQHPDNELEMEYESLQSDIQSVINSIHATEA